jgi:Family of unknown function (DUF6603)
VTNPLVSLMDVVADAVDWVHDTFSDPELSKEIRADLGLAEDADPQVQLPTGQRIRMRNPDGSAIDVDKAAFDATVAEVKNAVELIIEFIRGIGSPGDAAWDSLFLLGQIGASESIRARWPIAHNIARASGLTSALVRGAARPALTQSSEEVEAVDIFRAIDLLRGPSGAPSDPIVKPDARQQIRNLVGIGMSVAAAVKKFETINFLGSYGYEPDLLPVTGSDELRASGSFNDHLAVGAFTVDAVDADPAGTSGLDGHLALTIIYLPSFRVIPHPLFPEFPTCWHFAIGAGASFTSGRFTIGLEAPANTNVTHVGGQGWDFALGTVVRATASFGRPEDKAMEFGDRDGAHFTTDTFALRAEISATPSIRLDVKGVDLSLALTDGDAFVRSLSRELKATFDVAFLLDGDGFRMEGGPFAKQQAPPGPSPAPRLLRALGVGTTSGGVEAEVPPKTTRFGPFRIQKGRFAIGRGPTGDGSTSFELSTSVDLTIGPFNLTVDRIGMNLDLRAGGVEPNLGLLDWDFGYKHPTGIGVKIDAKSIRGGGFLRLDPDRGEYAGVLELSFSGLTIKAVGLVNTKAPEPAGWSFLLLLFAEFRDSPWQIGLGFNITAVGGIIGLQHRASVDELRTSLGTNVYDDILFPADPVKDAPRILGRLRTVFPVEPNGLVVGPTVEINWGTPAIVKGRFAVLAQFDGAFGGGEFRFTRLTILGTVRATAPPVDVDAPRLVELTADVLGDYDYESGLIAIDARLRDSKLGGVEFSGSLLIRIGTGNLPAFAISAGGFHPAFTDLPPAMPARLDRLGLRWQVGDNVTFTLQAYVAITASSWQLGAALTIVAELGPVDLDGGVHFDAIAYDDGRFSVELGLYVRIRWRGHTLMSVEADVVLDRNELQVWHAAGEATFSVLWWDKTVDFEHTWGDERSLPPVPAVDAAALVRAALEAPASWGSQLPQGGEALVTLASAPTSDVLAHPLGTLTVAQRVAPLGLRLDHVDGRPVAAGTVVTIDAVRVGGVSAPVPTPEMAPFPRARFQNLTEDERLTQRTFESLPAGARIAPPGQTNPPGTVRTFDFEPINLAPFDVDEPPPPGPITFPVGHLGWHVARGQAAASPLRQDVRLGALSPERFVDVRQPPVVVVDHVDLAPAVELSDVEASSAVLAAQRAGAGLLVVEAHELVGSP